MEKSRLFIIVLISVGSLALLFQAVGFFAPAWMSYDLIVKTDDTSMKIEVDMGLWASTGCVDSPELGGERCRSFSNDELKQAITGGSSSHTAQVAGLNILDDFTKVKVLATLGGLLCIVGLVFTCLHGRNDSTKTTGVISAACWGLGSILIFAAVGLQAQQNTNIEHGIDLIETMPEVSNKIKMKTHFPWAILMSGFGAGLGVVVALLLTVRLCYMDNPNAPGTWSKFGNQAI